MRAPAPPPAPPPDFDSVVCIPPDAPKEDPVDEGALPSRGQFELARIDAWALTHGLFADLKAGKVSREKVSDAMSQMAKKAADGDMDLFDHLDAYSQAGDGAVLAYLLNAAASNLNHRAGQ